MSKLKDFSIAKVDFDNRLSQLINQAKSRGPKAKGKLLELQALNNF
ncbi:MAG: hypothetical protein ICV80_09180 [Microcoleus sp. T1-bin1]|nr:hypothetical protein [Microcoleus sp. T1-bin1]